MSEQSPKTSLTELTPTAGGLIKAAREKAGIHLGILSVNLKVSVRQLEALEANQFDLLSEPVFARGLAAKVCRSVNLDPQSVLALMPVANNGLKPLRLIGAEQGDNFASQSLKHRSTSGSPQWGGYKLWLVTALVLLSLYVLGIYSDKLSDLFAMSSPTPAEITPIFPPASEAVNPDTPQPELPKAMVYESTGDSLLKSSLPTPLNPPVATLPEVKK
jgi:cytoskeleton protein RodZ